MKQFSRYNRFKYKVICKIIKHTTPYLYRKIQEHVLLSQLLDILPRPSIEIIKNHCKGKLIGAEIGVEKGNNTMSILKELNIEKLYLIDMWKEYSEHGSIVYSNKEAEKNYRTLLKRTKDKPIIIIKEYSENAVKCFKDNSLDFVYIDGNHTYNYVYNDINEWIKKVKINGIIAGHDIFNCIDVLLALNDWSKEHSIAYNIKPPDWYIIKKREII